jgi:Lrp/AsnC family transcriptional regulator for asnA, asnC and gidA
MEYFCCFFAEIIVTEGIEGVFDFQVSELCKIDGVSHAESFMLSKTRHKWTFIFTDIDGWP